MWNIFSKADGFPYRIQEAGHHLAFSCCSLHDGTHRIRGGVYSVFKTVTDSPEKRKYSYLNLEKLKTLRHPNILTYADHVLEEPHFVYVVTEKGTPLLEYLDCMENTEMKNEYIAWGILKILKALVFCHESAQLLHNNVGSNSVFVDRAGEWKLAEFGISDESYSGPITGTRAEQYHKWIRKNLKVTWELDTYGVAVLALEAYEGKIHSDQSIPKPSHKVPEPLRTTIKLIFSGEKIPTLQQFLVEGRASNGFRNVFIEKITFLEDIHQKTNEERREFYADFHKYLKHLPGNINKFKIFPLIMMTYDYGCEGSELLPSVLEFCKMKNADLDLVPMINRLYKSPNRKTRRALLEYMNEYITVVPPSIINDTIYPLWEVGFQDNSEIIRLETLKSTEYLVPMLSHQRITGKLLPRLFRRLVEETHGEIREMTLKTVLVIISNNVEATTKRQLLLTVITKVLKDEHPSIKSIAINSLVNLQGNFTQKDVATKLLPSLCLLTIDSSFEVKSSAVRAIRVLLDKIEESVPEETMPQTPKPVGSWTEWAKAKLSSTITSMFLEDDSPMNANIAKTLNSKTCRSQYITSVDEQTAEEKATDKKEMIKKSLPQLEDALNIPDLEKNQVWERDDPDELTNNNKVQGTEEKNRTPRSGKKLKGPRKLGTRINQRK